MIGEIAEYVSGCDTCQRIKASHLNTVGQLQPLSIPAYNNSYQTSLKMAPFEALYGRRCRTPLNWSQAGERTLFGPKLVQEAEEKVEVIRENLRVAQMR
jgi:hypothetical protein